VYNKKQQGIAERRGPFSFIYNNLMTSTTQTKSWPYTFAPKRQTWHADFFAPKIHHANVVLGVFNVSLVLFVAVFVTTQLPMLTSASLGVAPQVASIAGSSAVIDAMLPERSVVSFPRSVAYENSLHTAGEFALNFVASLVETSTQVWQNSFGAAAKVYVASVDEFMNEGGSVMQTEFATATVWNAWTDAVANGLYTPDSPVQMLMR
jgi:hypothetical protein